MYASAKIYRAGVLLCGKRPSIVERVRRLRDTQPLERCALAIFVVISSAQRGSAITPRREESMGVSVNPNMVTTAFDLPGYRVVRNYGLVRGVTVRSRSILGTIGASLETLVGGNITLFEEMCEKTREESLELMMEHASQHGANAVIGMRYDATEVMQGVTEVLAYGTAVQVERIAP
jgi:uncharacterized protein YbjQ (UPF0145 family)